MLRAHAVIDRSLNYGRACIRAFLDAARPYATVLDIGAGRGYDLDLARELQPDAKLVALETFDRSVQHLRDKGVETHALDIERDPYPSAPESVDVVIANQILEHTKELFWILHETSAALRVGGHLVIGVPNLAALHNRILLLAGRQPSPLRNSTAHVRGFTKRDLQALLDAGFPGGYRLAGFAGSNFYPFPPMLARPLARSFPSFAWGIFLDFAKVARYDRQFLDYPVSQRLETNFFLGP